MSLNKLTSERTQMVRVRYFIFICGMQLKQRNFESEFRFRTSRSSGKGGQHVNTTETKVELIFDVVNSKILSGEEKEKLQKRWSNRINDEGEFSVCSSQHRSQGMNKEHVVKKFFLTLEKALKKEKKRIATKVPEAVKEKIKEQKKKQSQRKSERQMKTRDFL